MIQSIFEKVYGDENGADFNNGEINHNEDEMNFPEGGMPARHCLRKIEDYHLLDFSGRLNTSSYFNVVFEPEEEKVALMGLKVNLADQTVYSQSFKMHKA